VSDVDRGINILLTSSASWVQSGAAMRNTPRLIHGDPTAGNTSDWVVAAFVWGAAGIAGLLTIVTQLRALL
jgi:hypothetical protein